MQSRLWCNDGQPEPAAHCGGTKAVYGDKKPTKSEERERIKIDFRSGEVKLDGSLIAQRNIANSLRWLEPAYAGEASKVFMSKS